MKKRILIFLMLATVLFSGISFLTGCSDSDGNADPGDKWVPETEQTDVFDNGCYLLADFETYVQCTQILWGRTFGKITRIDNADFITHGDWSVKLEIAGYEENWGKVRPYAKVATNAQYFKKKDFTDCNAFLFDMYSAMQEDLTILFCIDAPESANRVSVVLKPGWNHVEIPIAAETEKTEGNVSLPKDGVNAFCFVFDRGEFHETTQTVYFDNFRARKTA